MKLVKVAAAALNQTPFDWPGNRRNIKDAIGAARADGVTCLGLPELCITGYNCEDDFFREDLQYRAWRILLELAPLTKGMVATFGLPILHKNRLFNCIAVVADGEIRGFVAKKSLANDGIHYEARQFEAWPVDLVEQFEKDGKTYPIGDIYFRIGDVVIGFEICEGAWTGKRDGTHLVGKAVDLMFIPSASHFSFRKARTRRQIVLEGSRAFGCTTVFVNLLGNEAGRAIYDGDVIIAQAGQLAAVGRRFSYRDYELTSAVVDIEHTRMMQSRTCSFKPEITGVKDDRCIVVPFTFPHQPPVAKSEVVFEPWENGIRVKEEEFSRAIPLGLFDYLRKSRGNGFMLSLSGGADSTAVACQVKLMVDFGVADLGVEGFKEKLSYIKGLEKCSTKNELVNRLLVCAYQATKQSSSTTRNAAKKVAEAVGARFFSVNIDPIVKLYIKLAEKVIGRKMTWKQDDIPLQNVQARVRSPMIWLLANIFGMLLLATSNRSEGAVGYCTMDGDTSGGLSPVAGIDKLFLKWWLLWLQNEGPVAVGKIPALKYVTKQQPTAELRPLEQAQTDEKDLMPYDVLNSIEEESIENNRSPLECYQLIRVGYAQHQPLEISDWVQKFFSKWSINQWKRERLAPALHCDTRNLDPRTWRRSPILSGGFRDELADMRAYAQAITSSRRQLSTFQERSTSHLKMLRSCSSTASRLFWSRSLHRDFVPQNRSVISMTVQTAQDGVVTALFNVDGTNDFADYVRTRARRKSLLPVAGGRKIGPVIGRIQRWGKKTGKIHFQIGIRDSHKKSMFNFAAQNPGKTPYVDKVADRDGALVSIYPEHMIEGTWGWDWIRGTEASLFDATFRKGTEENRDEFSGATQEVLDWLRAHNVKRVVVVGLVKRICVGLTANALARAGFEVIVPEEAVRDLPIPDWQSVIDDFTATGVRNISVKELFSAL